MPELVLTTERLVLRPFHEDDFAAVHAYASDPEVCRYTSFGPNTEAETRDFLRRALAAAEEDPRTDYEWAVTDRGTGLLLGACGVHLYPRLAEQAELGYVLGRPYWGRGYATEAARAATDFGFAELRLHRLHAYVVCANQPSAHVLEKLGMRREGCLREAFRKGDRWDDLFLYAILESEWSAQNHAYSRP
jgi:ribosomal-protein-alanine N-acetyltransferase